MEVIAIKPSLTNMSSPYWAQNYHLVIVSKTHQPTMKRATYIFCAFVAVVLASCATLATKTPLSLHLSRGNIYLSRDTRPDSLVSTSLKKEVYEWGVMTYKSEGYTVFTPQGNVLRDYLLIEVVQNKGEVPDTVRHFKRHTQNFFNEKGELEESWEYGNDTLYKVVRFAYNKKGQLVEEVYQYMPEEKYVPLKHRYTYDRYGNICEEERYENDVFQSREVTRYNRKGQKLEVLHYRADGVLQDRRITTYNRHGEEVEYTLIEKWGTIHSTACLDWSINPFERDYWNEHQTPLKPIEKYDTISYRTTYHSKGKIATKQKMRASQGGVWKVTSRTEYNSKGLPTRNMAYGSEVDTLVTGLTIYDSRGLPTEEYRYNSKTGKMEIFRRKEFDNRRNCTLEVTYSDQMGIDIKYNLYDCDGNLVDESVYGHNGVLAWRELTQYENGKKMQVVKYGKGGRMKRKVVFEYDDNSTKSTVYDGEGAVIRTTFDMKSDTLHIYREYDGNGELLIDSCEEYFR